jgi:hypothetical protein
MSQKRMNVIATDAEQQARRADISREEAAEELARDREKKNKDFVQLSKKAISPLRALMVRSPRAAQILLAMVEEMGKQDNGLQVSMEALGAMTGAALITVRRALTLLKTEKWIEAVQGVQNTYRVNSTVFWMSYGNRKDGSFQATLNVDIKDKSLKVNKKVVRKVMPIVTVKTQRAKKGLV